MNDPSGTHTLPTQGQGMHVDAVMTPRNIAAAIIVLIMSGGITGAMPAMFGGGDSGLKESVTDMRKSVDQLRIDFAVAKGAADLGNSNIEKQLADQEKRIRVLEERRR